MNNKFYLNEEAKRKLASRRLTNDPRRKEERITDGYHQVISMIDLLFLTMPEKHLAKLYLLIAAQTLENVTPAEMIKYTKIGVDHVVDSVEKFIENGEVDEKLLAAKNETDISAQQVKEQIPFILAREFMDVIHTLTKSAEEILKFDEGEQTLNDVKDLLND